MADIFLVRATAEAGVDRYMVLKRVLAARARDPVFAQLFLDEARLAAQLQHSNIAQVYDVGKLGGSYFFSMEYVHGEDLRVLLKHCAGKKQLIPINLALFMASGALAALHHAHERTNPEGAPLGIVHRDVSPSNVMVSYEGGIKMIDFGVAKAAQRTTNTNAGSIKGKFGYMSPEQCRGNAVDRRSDVFSLGIVLHELLTGKRLFKRDNDYLSMAAIVNDDTPPPSKQRPELSEEIDRIVATALARDPDRRYASAAAMLEDIEAVATAERHLLSATAMGRFMREQFGIKPEPWHVLRDQVGEQLEIAGESLQHHDGTMTDVPIELGDEDLVDQLADAPLLRPQHDPGSATPTPVVDAASSPTAIAQEPSSFTPTPSSSSFTPNPSSSSFTPAPSSQGSTPAPAPRRRMVVIAGSAVVAIAVGVAAFAAMFGGKDSSSSAASAQQVPDGSAEASEPPAPPPAPPHIDNPPATANDQRAGNPPSIAPAHATLEVAISGVKGAVVRVDGTDRGRGPLVKLELAPGPHEIVVVATGRTTVTKRVDLGAGHATVLEIVVPPAAAQRPRPPSGKPARDPCTNREYVKANPLKCQ